ncbi:hypothetical protein YC2023_012488 [Brassica napus]
MADALSRRRNDVSGTKEVQELTGTLASLRLCAVTAEGETAGLEALEHADLLWRIRRSLDSDDALVKQIKIETQPPALKHVSIEKLPIRLTTYVISFFFLMDFSWCKRRTISRVSPPLSTSSYRWIHRSSPTTTAQRLESSQSTGETCRDHCRYITTPPFVKVVIRGSPSS